MSDYIDETLRAICRIVVEKMPCSCPPGTDPQFDEVCANCNARDDVIDVAKAVAAEAERRVMERAKLCRCMFGSYGMQESLADCPACHGTGITFDKEPEQNEKRVV